MANRTVGLDEKIEKSAWEEFSTFGFKDASANRIAKNAGVTSGAIYTRYSDKNDIFVSLVGDALKGFEEKIESYQKKYADLSVSDSWILLFSFEKTVLDDLLDYIFENLDAFKLLVCHSEGSSISNFADKWIQFKYHRSYEFMERVHNNYLKKSKTQAKLPIEKEELALLASAQYHCLFEVIRYSYSKEKAKRYIHTVQDVYTAGLKSVLGEFY